MSPAALSDPEDHDHEGACPSIRDIQLEYILNIGQYFLRLTDLIQVGNFDACKSIVEALFEWLSGFWIRRVLCMEDQINEFDSLRVVCGIDSLSGEITRNNPNVVSSVGLYVDTVVLTDPVSVQLQMLNSMLIAGISWEQVVVTLVQSMAAALKYQSAVTAELTPPICLFMPEIFSETEITKFAIEQKTQADAIVLFSGLMKKKFTSFEHLRLTLGRIKSLADLDKKVVNRSLWSSATGTHNHPSEFMMDILNVLEQFGTSSHLWNAMTVGQKIGFHFTGKYTVINELELRSWMLDSNPLFLSEHHWNLWRTKRLILSRGDRKQLNDLDVSRILSASQSTELKMLTELPIDDLVFFRKEGAFVELRNRLFRGIHAIDGSSMNDSERVEQEVSANLKEIIAEHSIELENLASENRKFLGQSIIPFMTTTAFAVCAAGADDPTKCAAAVLGVLGFGKTMQSVKKDWDSLIEKRKKHRLSPAGLLIRKIRQ